MRFQKGQSGNPAGKPKGAKDKRTELRALLQPHAEALIQKAVDLALAGDTTALRICVDRLIPPIRSDVVTLPGLEGSLAEQGKAVLEALARGEITPDAAATILQAIVSQARVVEADELERRVAAIEQRMHLKTD
jgi:hypothetical protein